MELLKKVADNEELQAQFGKLESLDEAYELAGKIQQGFSKEEFLEAMKIMNEAADEDVSDEELAAAAGGDYEPAGETYSIKKPETLSKPKFTQSGVTGSDSTMKILSLKPNTQTIPTTDYKKKKTTQSSD